jgi:hypothetical protein
MFPFRQFSLLTSAYIAKNSVFGINEFAPLSGKTLVFSQYGRFCLPLNGILLRLLFIGVGVGFLPRRPR